MKLGKSILESESSVVECGMGITGKEYRQIMRVTDLCPLGAPEINGKYYELPISTFFDEQEIRYDKAIDWKTPERSVKGCCLNLSAFLLKKFNGLMLTAPCYNNGVHCAVVYLDESGEVVVTDPSLDWHARNEAKKTGMQFKGKRFTKPLLDYDYAPVNMETGERLEPGLHKIFFGGSIPLEKSNETLVDALLDGKYPSISAERGKFTEEQIAGIKQHLLDKQKTTKIHNEKDPERTIK